MTRTMIRSRRLRPHRARIVPLASMLAAVTVALVPTAKPASGTDAPSHPAHPASHSIQPAPVDALPDEVAHRLAGNHLGRPDGAATTSAISAPASHPVDPIDMRVLVLATKGDPNPDGVHTTPPGSWDFDLSTFTSSLDYVGTPYDVYKSTTKQLCVNGTWKIDYIVSSTDTTCTSGSVTDWTPGVEASRLWDGAAHAYYQGVMQTNGTLAYFDASNNFVSSSLTAAEWTSLWTFEAAFGIRTVSADTYPTADFGMIYVGEDANPSSAKYTSAGANVFPYVNASGVLPIANAYTYRAKTEPTDPTTSSLITDESGNTLAVLHTYPNQGNRQAVALTFDSASYLLHGQVLGYGLVSWVTQGLFLGERHAYLDPEPDDVFIADSIWQGPTDPVPTPCGTLPDDPSLPQYRITGDDLRQVIAWQSTLVHPALTKGFALELPFVGEGTVPGFTAPSADTLTPVAKKNQALFKWVSHTYTHMNLDSIVVPDAVLANATDSNGAAITTISSPTVNLTNTWDQAVFATGIPDATTIASVLNPHTAVLSQVAPPAGPESVIIKTTYSQALQQLQQNNAVATQLGLTRYTKVNLIQPDISGLNNPEFLQAAVDFGIKYLISDTSRTGDPAHYGPNEGAYNATQPSLLQIARYPVNLYFNVSTPDQWLAEDNCLYPASAPFGHVTTYQQLLDRESTVLLRYLLQGHNRPLMFHQPNLRAYDGKHSLLSDLLNATLAKYAQLVTVPIQSPTENRLGELQAARMQYNDAWKNAGLSGRIVPGKAITLTASKAVTVPVTGLKASAFVTEMYAGQKISYIPLTAGQILTVPLQ